MHDSILLAPRGDNWCWDSFTIGIFEWVKSTQAANGKQRSPVKVRVTCGFDQAGINKAKAKAQEVIRALDYGMYNGPDYIRL